MVYKHVRTPNKNHFMHGLDRPLPRDGYKQALYGWRRPACLLDRPRRNISHADYITLRSNRLGLHGDDLLRIYCGFQKSLNRLNVWDVGFSGKYFI